MSSIIASPVPYPNRTALTRGSVTQLGNSNHLATGILTSVRWKIQLLLRQYKKVIPTWPFDFIDTSTGASDCLSTAKHPWKKTNFSIPSFRDLWKVHKEEIGTRPLHGKHT